MGQEGHSTEECAPGKGMAPIWSNLITMLGLFCAGAGAILTMTFGLFVATTRLGPYGALVGYIGLPALLVLGAVLTPMGILWKSWRLHCRNPRVALTMRFPRVSLEDPRQRAAALVAVLGTCVLVSVAGFSGYRAYVYTDSRAFCAETCHTVMRPQGTTHAESPHAHVGCAECHMGSGANWFVKSKLSGMPQVLAVFRDSFPRPIPAAISDLRPTRETCVQCHWDRKGFATQLKRIVRFSSDERNAQHNIDILLKTGSYAVGAQGTGIHAHMGQAGKIEYAATDGGLQKIPWVRQIDGFGQKIVYRSDGVAGSEPPAGAIIRQFDCMDCHNRPAHKFRSPQDAVDMYLSHGKLDSRLPYLKREAVAALMRAYSDDEEARVAIAESIGGFYKTNYPNLLEAFAAPIAQAASGVFEIWRRSFFPVMKVQWQTYPDNIGHLNSPGCFRCHDGEHVNERGEAIRFECDLCHSFLVGEAGTAEGLVRETEFVHSYPQQGAHIKLQCVQCHDGGASPLFSCARCHTK